jgi:predicted RNA binding protein YcfA (HicA-like mRNA interferase family)
MRKALAEASSIYSSFSVPILNSLKKQGFKFVQIRGITVDYHYDYTEPSRLLLVPCKELPIRADEKDIYESLESELLLEWAKHPDEGATVVVARV